ncbi:MAG: hypothetical protein LIQ31_07860 [Planctomycetes bacterium]|nr:hypothetical protein [Planctomycetota bacterium]
MEVQVLSSAPIFNLSPSTIALKGFIIVMSRLPFLKTKFRQTILKISLFSAASALNHVAFKGFENFGTIRRFFLLRFMLAVTGIVFLVVAKEAAIVFAATLPLNLAQDGASAVVAGDEAIAVNRAMALLGLLPRSTMTWSCLPSVLFPR